MTLIVNEQEGQVAMSFSSSSSLSEALLRFGVGSDSKNDWIESASSRVDQSSPNLRKRNLLETRD